MRVLRGVQPNLLSAAVVTLGMFDGVHRGHQALLQACRFHADALLLPAVTLTYDPHPMQVLHPDASLRLLTPLPEKLERLADYGMDYVLVAEFTPEFARYSPEQFLNEVIKQALHAQVVVAGYRTTFGHNRAGNAEALSEMGARYGFTVEIVPPVEINGIPVSSTRIRQCLEAGDVELATQLLGYAYRLEGIVVHGDGRGRALGVPTANLEVTPSQKLVPGDGVYAVTATVGNAVHRAVMNIGARPTFQRPRSLEVHLLDCDADLYQQPLTVTFLRRLRDIRPFTSVEALLTQIRQDIAAAREVISPVPK